MSECITKIEVRGLWGRENLVWHLQPDVNILAGRNGSGKTTLMRALTQLTTTGDLSPELRPRLGAMTVTFADGSTLSSGQGAEAPKHRVDTIGPFESRFRTCDYTALLAGEEPADRTLFCESIDEAFAHTGKRVDRTARELRFDSPWGTLTPEQLSSGEKQLLLIFATVLAQNDRPAILLLDEPEVSLHFDWQAALIGNILRLNPQVQLILSTHSPAVVMNGWMGHVVEISDLVVSG